MDGDINKLINFQQECGVSELSSDQMSGNGGFVAATNIKNLREKINAIKVLLGYDHDQQFAEHIGREPNTLAGYFSDRGAYAANDVPEKALLAMAEALRQALDERISLDQALDLWRGDLNEFRSACFPGKTTSFREAVAAARRAKIMTLRLFGARNSLEAIEFEDDNNAQHDKMQVGDRFYFDCVGPSDHWLVLLVESCEGFQLGCPRTKDSVKFPSNGYARVPMNSCWKVTTNGLHRFLLFAINSKEAPPLCRLDKPLLLLTERERDDFAHFLVDRRQARSWIMDEKLIYVVDRNAE